MLDIGWSEMLMIGVVMILIVGPRELPGMLRSIGRSMRAIKQTAGQFQSQFNEALRDAEEQSGLGDVKSSVENIAFDEGDQMANPAPSATENKDKKAVVPSATDPQEDAQ